jgi:hypothetical protein
VSQTPPDTSLSIVGHSSAAVAPMRVEDDLNRLTVTVAAAIRVAATSKIQRQQQPQQRPPMTKRQTRRPTCSGELLRQWRR